MTKIPHECSDEDLIPNRNDLVALLNNDADIQTQFTYLRKNLSMCAKNVLYEHNLLNVGSLLPWIVGIYNDFYSLKYCNRKVSNELVLMVDKLRDYINQRLFKEYSASKITDWVESIDTFVLIGQKNYNLFFKMKGCGKKSAEELMSMTENLYSYIDQCIKKHIVNMHEYDNDFFDIIAHSPLIQNEFNKEIKKLSNRAYNVLNKAHLLDLKSLLSFIKSGVIQPDCINKTEKALINKIPISNYSYSEEEVEFLNLFREKNGHWPMFYLLQNYFTHSQKKNEIIFTQFWGLANGKTMSLKTLAGIYNCSSETIRQLLRITYNNPKEPLKTIINSKEWKFYNILELSYLYDNDISTIVRDERLVQPLNLFVILKCLGNRLFFLDKEKTELYDYIHDNSAIPITLNKKYVGFKLKKILREIHRLSSLHTDQEIKISLIKYFIENEDYWESSISLQEKEKKQLSFLLERIGSGIIQIKDNNIIINANKFNYQETIYLILKESGERLCLSDIYKKMRDKCYKSGFECRYKNPAQIKRFLSSDERIISIGKSSYWGLKEWGENLFSIKDTAINILSKSETPIKKEKLANEVYKFRPDSTIKSISSIISQCTCAGDMLLFFGDFVGLPNKTYSEEYILFPRDFNEWVLTFKEFVIKNNRFPYSNQKGYEGYLYRWYFKAKSFVNLSAEEILSIESLEKELLLYPHDSKEVLFRENCILYQKFVEQNKRMINIVDDRYLFNWFSTTKKKLNSLTDNQIFYFNQLINVLTELYYL